MRAVSIHTGGWGWQAGAWEAAACTVHSVVRRNVVPYLPGLLLLWKGHLNVQRVTQEGWSVYLLKYQLKVRLLAPCHVVCHLPGMAAADHGHGAFQAGP
jgi:hypothetical protein